MRHEPSPLATGLCPNEARGPENGTAPTDPSNSAPGEQRLKHVLVVDDDPALRAMVANYLVDQNVRVGTASNAREMARVLTAGGMDLAILDLKLGNENGFEIVRALRAESDLPIIVLTGQHLDEIDGVVGLELGADDHLTKPFSPRELLARIRAVLRRSQVRQPEQDAKRTRYRFAGWVLSLRNRRLTSPSGEIVPLTKGEFALLTALLQSPQRVLSRERLLGASRVHDHEVFDRSIDIQILRLRRKIEVDAAAPELIKTERGAGYIFSAPVEVV
jgi:two-component system, OmpR family, response regulator